MIKKVLKKTKTYKMYKNINDLKNENIELKNTITKLNEKLDNLQFTVSKCLDLNYENMYANIFHDTSKNSEWLKTPLSLGTWAIGYPYAYILYRTLSEFKPKNILEMGLGQSTKIITDYVLSDSNIKHDVVEPNKEWIEFFKHTTDMSKFQNVHQLKMVEQEYNGKKYNAYENFKNEFKNMKFDFISIDGPLGGGNEYSRMDVIDIIPKGLKDSFVIMLDDCERIGEINMINELENKLRKSNIKFCSGIYRGQKNVYVCTSLDFEFLCHL